ncbi:MAG: glycosyl transferase [Solirubrobacterales bacterium]|nr:glycosyl transferase [Solirubrobacterales bacterium]
MRCLIGAFGDPGHVFPAISLARGLRARGHRVLVETWPRWKEAVEGAGVEFAGADQYQVFPPPASGSPGSGEAAVALGPLLAEFDPDLVVNDVLTPAPALAAEAHGCPRATLIPHIYPDPPGGMPLFAIGAQPPRTAIGRRAWAAAAGLLTPGLKRGRTDLNAQRAKVGLEPIDRYHGSTSPDLALLATYPQLEYPREWPDSVELTGPMPYEMPHPEIELPPGEEPLVLVAPSTSKDPGNRLLRSALEALADQPVRVVATTNRPTGGEPIAVPPNAVLVEWLSYAQVMPLASLIICHGGHGTVARALAEGVPVLTCPADGDMNETAARITWAGVGLSVRRSLVRPSTVKWAAAEILADPAYREKAGEIAAWDRRHDGPARGSELLEELVARV